jgi:hypothetical protein
MKADSYLQFTAPSTVNLDGIGISVLIWFKLVG